MTDYLWNTTSETLARSLVLQQKNTIIGKGIPAQAETIDNEGNAIPASLQIGDPDRWYLNIRTQESLPTPDGAEITDPALSQQILGGWAE